MLQSNSRGARPAWRDITCGRDAAKVSTSPSRQTIRVLAGGEGHKSMARSNPVDTATAETFGNGG